MISLAFNGIGRGNTGGVRVESKRVSLSSLLGMV